MDHDKDTHHNKSSHKNQEFSFDDQQAGFMMGAVVGALVGGAAALLLSPKNGKEMREVVKKYSKDLESEAYELAKESRGVAKSFKSVLEDGAVDVMEQAPERLEQASYQAQQLAGDLNERFESARDVVAELAEAFRSGWEEYGEDRAEDENFDIATPILFDADEPAKEQKDADVEEGQVEDTPHMPVHGRRRSHGASGYSMHSSKPSVDDQPAHHEDVATKESASKRDDDNEDNEVKPAKTKSTTRSYTTRVVEEPRKVSTAKSKAKTDDDEEIAKKTAARTKKKLLFRRG